MENSKNSEPTIIILTCNSAHIIASSLTRLNRKKYKIIVVDNASKDNTSEIVRKNFPDVCLIENPKNSGYGRGNNIALKLVASEFAVVLNPDAMITEESIDKVIDAMVKNKKVATAGPLILAQEDITQEAVKNQMQLMEKDNSSLCDMYYEKIDDGFDTRFISGACIFFRMEILRRIGFFDEKIFMFYEDNEICLRAKKNGYQNLTVIDAVVCHVGASSSEKNWRVTFRRSWHLLGWSKLYWKKMEKGDFRAKKSALRLGLSYLVKSILALVRFNSRDLAANLGAFCGSLMFLMGCSAFKADGCGRG